MENNRNVWYRICTIADYAKLGQIGEVTTTLRFLPGWDGQNLYEALFEKDVSRTRYPNTPKWLVPVYVLNDMLHPEKNGFVGVLELSKSIYKKIKANNAPQNYWDFNNGFNFNVVISLGQNEKTGDYFPNYFKSKFDSNPSTINGNEVMGVLKSYEIVDFKSFVDKINQPKETSVQVQPVQQVQVNPTVNTANSYNMQSGNFNQVGTPPVQQVPVQQPQTQVPVQQPQTQVPVNENNFDFNSVGGSSNVLSPQPMSQENDSGYYDEGFDEIFNG